MSIDISSHSANETKITNSQIVSIKIIKYKTWTECREQLFKDSQKWTVAGRLGRDQNLKYHWTNNEFTIPNHCRLISRGKWPPGQTQDCSRRNPLILAHGTGKSTPSTQRILTSTFFFPVLLHPRSQVIHELVEAKILGKRHFPLLSVKLWFREGGAKTHCFFSVSSCHLAPDTGTVM